MIIAIDFDGILCKNKFPEIGEPNYDIISIVQQLIDKGHKVILWTSRVNERLKEATDWCEKYGLHFSGINENESGNLAEFGTDPRKIFADVYVDDHNLEYVFSGINSHWSATQCLNRLLNMEENKE